MPGKVMLETARMQLAEFCEDDLDVFYILGTDPLVTRFIPERLRDMDHAREIMRDYPLRDYRVHGYGRWAVMLKENARVIGFCGLKYLEELKVVDVGYRFLSDYWGRGLATESAHASVDYGFNRLNLERIYGLVDPANVASVRVLEKLGMSQAGEVEYRGMRHTKYALEAAAWQ